MAGLVAVIKMPREIILDFQEVDLPTGVPGWLTPEFASQR